MNNKAARPHILFVSTEMHMGGVTTALLALLRTIDTSKYDVDLLLYDHNGVLQAEIPPEVRLLPAASAHRIGSKYSRLLSPAFVKGRIEALRLEKLQGRLLEGMQLRSRLGAQFTQPCPGQYDLASSFIEFWPLYYTATKVIARHKLARIHIDYKSSGLSVQRDACAFPNYDRIVTVSQECVQHLRELCPAFADRAIYMPNLVSEALIRSRADAAPSVKLSGEPGRRLVTVARLQLAHKGLDRGVRAFDRLRRRGLLQGATWSIIGSGADEEALRTLILELGRENEIFLLGQQLNPLPIVAQADAFLITSHYEGKPIAVTEAQILGLPVLATNYASAAEQITDGVDGLIVENSVEGIERGLERLMETPRLLETLKHGVQARHYGNESEIEKYYALFEEIGVKSEETKGGR